MSWHRCLSYLPRAVGKNPAHFDLSLARKQPYDGRASGDWLVLHVQELISLAYQVLNVKFQHVAHITLICVMTKNICKVYPLTLLLLFIDKYDPVWEHAANWCGTSRCHYGQGKFCAQCASSADSLWADFTQLNLNPSFLLPDTKDNWFSWVDFVLQLLLVVYVHFGLLLSRFLTLLWTWNSE